MVVSYSIKHFRWISHSCDQHRRSETTERTVGVVVAAAQVVGTETIDEIEAGVRMLVPQEISRSLFHYDGEFRAVAGTIALN